MHYHINDFLVKSEYSALPVNRYNKIVRRYIEAFLHQQENAKILDYGCGKLRNVYSFLPSHDITGIDSSYQITRTQKINGEYTSLKELSEKFTKLKVFDTDHIKLINKKYDLILCNNVFSAIPFDTEIKKIVQFIKDHLADTGQALISTQFKNSYFDKYQEKDNSYYYNNGWIITNNNKTSYYRIVSPSELKGYVHNMDMKITSEKIDHGSIYLIIAI